MKGFLFRTFLFYGFSFLVYLILVIVTGSYAPRFLAKNLSYRLASAGFLNTRLKDVDSVHDVDILVVGSSHSYRGYDPRIFKKNGYKIFVLGSNAQSPLQTEVLLNQHIKKLNPKLVVLDVFPALFGNDGVESCVDLLASGKIDHSMAKMVLRVNNIKCYNTLLYSYWRKAFKLDKNFKEGNKRGNAEYISGGYVEMKHFQHKPSGKKPLIGEVVVIESQIAAFKRILKILRDQHRPYIMVQAPIPAEAYNAYLNNDQLDTAFHALGDYYNFNKITPLNDSMFLDYSHLNQYGTEKFNLALLNLIFSTPLVLGDFRNKKNNK